MAIDLIFSFAGALAALIAFTFLAQSAWLRKALAIVVRRIRDNDLS